MHSDRTFGRRQVQFVNERHEGFCPNSRGGNDSMPQFVHWRLCVFAKKNRKEPPAEAYVARVQPKFTNIYRIWRDCADEAAQLGSLGRSSQSRASARRNAFKLGASKELLSEWCHPKRERTLFTFGKLGKKAGTVNFS